MRLAVPLFLISGLALAAQSPAAVPLASTAPTRVPGEQALAHRIGHDRPAYPHFARAAGIEGVVKANLIIGSDGNIKRQMEITGPPSLIASAQAWINASHFRPFVRGGQPVAIATTLPVVFRLLSGTHPARPLLAIYQRNITATIGREGRDNPPQVRWPALSPAMRDWVARYEAAITADRMADSSLTLDEIIAREDPAQSLVRMPGNIALYPVPLSLPGRHLYLLFEFSIRCGKSNCPLVLLEESSAGVHAVINQFGLEADLHRRHDSPYPDVLIWSDSGQAGISTISGYSYYAGEWGQIYCGSDDAAQDSELDDEAVEHHDTHVPRRPLVTLCK